MNCLKLKISRQRILAVSKWLDTLIEVFTCESAHEYLLFQMIVEMSWRFEKLIAQWDKTAKMESVISIKFGNSEIVAFCQVWKLYEGYAGAYEKVVMQEIVNEASKISLNANLLNG